MDTSAKLDIFMEEFRSRFDLLAEQIREVDERFSRRFDANDKRWKDLNRRWLENQHHWNVRFDTLESRFDTMECKLDRVITQVERHEGYLSASPPST